MQPQINLVDKFESEMAPLRDALRRAVEQRTVTPYRDLTIRQMFSFVYGARNQELRDPENIAAGYDVDDPGAFASWQEYAGHLHDIDYARNRLCAEPLNYLVYGDYSKGPGNEWIHLLVRGAGRDPILMAMRVRRLQEMGVSFVLRSAGDILKEFNKEVGIRKRCLRLEERRNTEKQ